MRLLGDRGRSPRENFTVFDHLKHRKRSRRMYENSENFNSLWENIFLDFELMGKVFANHPPTPGGVSRSFGRKSKISHKPIVSTYYFPIRRMSKPTNRQTDRHREWTAEIPTTTQPCRQLKVRLRRDKGTFFTNWSFCNSNVIKTNNFQM